MHLDSFSRKNFRSCRSLLFLTANAMTIHLKRKGLSISRFTENLLYATSRCHENRKHRQKCFLHFKDEILEYNYRLNVFEDKTRGVELFRVHRCYLVKLREVIGYADHQAKISNGELIPLNDYGYDLVKNFVDHKIHP